MCFGFKSSWIFEVGIFGIFLRFQSPLEGDKSLFLLKAWNWLSIERAVKQLVITWFGACLFLLWVVFLHPISRVCCGWQKSKVNFLFFQNCIDLNESHWWYLKSSTIFLVVTSWIMKLYPGVLPPVTVSQALHVSCTWINHELSLAMIALWCDLHPKLYLLYSVGISGYAQCHASPKKYPGGGSWHRVPPTFTNPRLGECSMDLSGWMIGDENPCQ